MPHPECNNVLHNLNAIITEPLSYFDFLKLEKYALAVLTDSGGIQEETTYLGVPCMTMRENTERPVTISDGTNKLVGLNHDKIINLLDFCLQGRRAPKKRPILWDGQTAERIVRILEEQFAEKAEDKIRDKHKTKSRKAVKV